MFRSGGSRDVGSSATSVAYYPPSRLVPGPEHYKVCPNQGELCSRPEPPHNAGQLRRNGTLTLTAGGRSEAKSAPPPKLDNDLLPFLFVGQRNSCGHLARRLHFPLLHFPLLQNVNKFTVFQQSIIEEYDLHFDA